MSGHDQYSGRGDASKSVSAVQRDSIRDHEGNNVSIVWHQDASRSRRSATLPPFPYQVYVTRAASKVAADENFPITLVNFLGQITGYFNQADCNYHLEIYSRSFPSILACVAHQRNEVRHRNRNGIVPRLVRTWTVEYDQGFQGRIMVIDTDNWIEDGVTLVSFDPAEYRRPSRDSWWDVSGNGDHDVVIAERYQAKGYLLQELGGWWEQAGDRWTEDDLARRNDGGFSPVLYPAVDPAAHHDAEHDDGHELDGTALPGPFSQSSADEVGDDGLQRIIDTFDKEELFKHERDLVQFRSEVYGDSFGFPVTSVWDHSFSTSRPNFTVTLYLSFDLLPLRPKALFGCLNRGLIQQEPWTLDIVSNMPGIEAAFEYHTRTSLRRTPTNVARARVIMHKMVEKVAASRLPNELLQYIEDFLVPPEIPTYSSRPCRPFKNVFMFLDMDHICTGPLLVYSNPEGFWNDVANWQPGFTEPDPRPSMKGRAYAYQEVSLRVVFLRYWHRVADEMHILWSLCSPRALVPSLPSISLKLTMPEVCVWRVTGPQYIDGFPDVKLTLHSKESIRVHQRHFFSHDIWEEAVEVFDIEAGHVLAPLPHQPFDDKYCFDSWSSARDLGFASDLASERLDDLDLKPLHPGGPTSLGIYPEPCWWYDRARTGLFKSGREYIVRVKPGLTVPKWVYGESSELKEHYKLPPLPVAASEALKFKFRVES